MSNFKLCPLCGGRYSTNPTIEPHNNKCICPRSQFCEEIESLRAVIKEQDIKLKKEYNLCEDLQVKLEDYRAVAKAAEGMEKNHLNDFEYWLKQIRISLQALGDKQ